MLFVLDSLSDRKQYRKLVFFYKIMTGLPPSYLQIYFLPDNEKSLDQVPETR